MNVNNYIDINVNLLIYFSMITNYRLFKYKVLPSDNVLPSSYEEANELLKMLGVEHGGVTHKPILYHVRSYWGKKNQKIKKHYIAL